LSPAGAVDEYFYSKVENLVLWARSEKIGFAVNIHRGMMEYWKDGMLGLVDCGLLFIRMAWTRK
jgi:hypothetical protein